MKHCVHHILGIDVSDRFGIGRHGEPVALARSLFSSLRRGRRRNLLVQDFHPYFDSAEEAECAFGMFDTDGNGDVSPKEFLDSILNAYADFTSLHVSMSQSSQAISKLDSLLMSFVWVVIVFATLSIFGVNTDAFLATTISIWLGLVFALGSTVRNLVERYTNIPSG